MTPCTLLHETQNHTQDTKSKLMKQNVPTHILKKNQLQYSNVFFYALKPLWC